MPGPHYKNNRKLEKSKGQKLCFITTLMPFEERHMYNNGNPRQGGLPQIWYFPFEPSHAAEEVVYAFLTITYQYFYSDECSWIRKWKLHQKVSGHDFQAAFIQATSMGIIHSAEDCSNFSRSSEYSRRPDCGFPRHSTIVFPPHFPHLQDRKSTRLNSSHL